MIGAIILYAGNENDYLLSFGKWLRCNGSQISRKIYSKLFSVVGIRHGSGDGKSTFHLPDFRHRFPRGTNTTSEYGLVDEKQHHALSADQLPLHQHQMDTMKMSEAEKHIHTVNERGQIHSIGVKSERRYYNYGQYEFNAVTDHSSTLLTSTTVRGISLNDNGQHQHAINAEPIQSTGNGTQFEIFPPYINVEYLIYTG